MKIAYFSESFLPVLNGVTTWLVNQATGLSKKGHEVHIFASSHRDQDTVNFEVEGVNVTYISSVPFLMYPDFRFMNPVSPKAYNKVRAFDPDIIHFVSPTSSAVPAILTAKTLQKPLIGTFHAYFMEPEYLKAGGIDNVSQKLASEMLWDYTLFMYNRCDGIICPSKESKLKITEKGIKKNIQVIHNALNTDLARHVGKEKATQLKKKLGLKKHVVIYVGRVSPEKNIDQLIDSFILVLKDIPDSSLCIIGKGPALEKLKSSVKERGYENNIIFTGEVAQSSLLNDGYFQTADVFATASTSEIQPVSIIEAYHFGLPVVGSNKRGTGEMIKGIGLLSEPDDTEEFAKNIKAILAKPDLKKELSKKSIQAFKQRYNLDKTVQQHIDYYNSFV